MKIFLNFHQQFASRIDEMEEMLTNNRIWKQRLVDIGVVTADQALRLGLFWCNVSWFWYFVGIYVKLNLMIYIHQINFDIPVGTRGDCYDRYLIRIEEMRQSLRIIIQCINEMPVGTIKIEIKKLLHLQEVK